ncbi:MAG: hypothetical protein FJ034_02000, partial [Chloroflexi bacterium]|nr:hypothetical protein [Chloroflexota bacterium]
ELWDLNADETLVLVAGAGLAAAGALGTTLRERGLVPTDVSSGIAALRLIGPKARAILEEHTAIDLSAAALADGRIAFGPLASVQVTLARRDRQGTPGFTILVDRDLAEHVWDSLEHTGKAHGLVPAGCWVEG